MRIWVDSMFGVQCEAFLPRLGVVRTRLNHLDDSLDLEERLEIIHLPRTNEEEKDRLADGPPHYTLVCRLCGIAMHTFADDNILLLIFDGLKTLSERTNLLFDRSHVFVFGDVQHTMNVEADNLVGNGAHDIGETILVSPVALGRD